MRVFLLCVRGSNLNTFDFRQDFAKNIFNLQLWRFILGTGFVGFFFRPPVPLHMRKPPTTNLRKACWLLAGLLARWLACLLAPWQACSLVCCLACLLSFLLLGWLTCLLPGCQASWLPGCLADLLACSLDGFLACLLPSLLPSLLFWLSLLSLLSLG